MSKVAVYQIFWGNSEFPSVETTSKTKAEGILKMQAHQKRGNKKGRIEVIYKYTNAKNK